nr:putative ribonuclease H-like domain-containing protein [Tanacetum cinerariifolium]
KPQDHCSTEVPEGSGNLDPIASTSNPSADQMETLIVETPIPTVSSPVPTAYSTDSQEPSSDARLISKRVANQEETPSLDNILSLTNRFEDILRVTTNSDESNGVEADISNMEIAITASPTPTLRIHKDHPKSQIIGHVDTLIQTKNKSKKVLKNKKDERGIVIRNKARLVAQGHIQKEEIDYDEVFAPIARIEAIRLFLAYASFMGFIVYQMDVKSAFLYGTIDKEVPDIMFAICACARHQVTPKECHLHAVKRIFRYLKGHPKLGIWYPKESPFDLVAYSDSNYGGATQDRKSTTEGCQFLGRRLISCQCKKQTIVATSPTEAEYVAAASCCGQVLWIQNQLLDYGDCFEKKLISVDHIHTDENVADLLTKPFDDGRFQYLVSEHNIDFHPMVDFIEASPLRIETTEEGTQILATVDGIHRTVTESSLRKNLKLKDEAGISSLPDMKLFENLTLMGYNISPNQKFTFQKGQFSHQWKYLIHTIMQYLSPKSTGFNEFSSNIATALVCLATNRTYKFSKMIFDGLVKNVNNKGEGSGTPTEPHHTPSPEAQLPSPTTNSSPTLPPVTTTSIPAVTLSETTPIRHYTRRARIAQSFALPTVANELDSPLRDVSQGEACPTDSGFIADQDRATVAKSSTLPYESVPRVTSPDADEGTQEEEINRLKERVKLLEDRDGVATQRSGDDAPIKGRSVVEGEGNCDVPTGSGSIPTASSPADEVPTGSDVVLTASPVFATATMVTPYSRRKGKEFMVESDTLKKQKVQEQIDAQVAREPEEQLEREDQRRSAQIARDAEIVRIHVEEELQIMIDGLDRNNETVAKYLQEYHQFASELPIERRIELINDLVKYQDNYTKVHKFQSQQRKPWTKKQKKDYYMAVIRSNLGWKVKDFRGMTFKKVEAKFNSVWKQIENFIPMGSKEEAERFKRKGISFKQRSTKK